MPDERDEANEIPDLISVQARFTPSDPLAESRGQEFAFSDLSPDRKIEIEGEPRTVEPPPGTFIPVAGTADFDEINAELEKYNKGDRNFFNELTERTVTFALQPLVTAAKVAGEIAPTDGTKEFFGEHVAGDVIPDVAELVACPTCYPRFIRNLYGIAEDLVLRGEKPYLDNEAITLSEAIADSIGSSRGLSRKGPYSLEELQNIHSQFQSEIRERQLDLIAQAAQRVASKEFIRRRGPNAGPSDPGPEFNADPGAGIAIFRPPPSPVPVEGPEFNLPPGQSLFRDKDAYPGSGRVDDLNDLLPIGPQLLPGMGVDSPEHRAEVRAIAGAGGSSSGIRQRCVASYVQGFQTRPGETNEVARTRLVRGIADGIAKGALRYCGDKRRERR